MSFQLSHEEPPLWTWWQRALCAFFVLLLCYASLADAVIPTAAQKHRRALTANAHAVWGLSAPIATFAAQVHQESGWNENARSPFAGGLAQFTPDTANWISRTYNDELPQNDPYNPSWALRALVRYDRHLWDRSLPAASDCDRMGFALAGYNGGSGHISRERTMCKSSGGVACSVNSDFFQPRYVFASQRTSFYAGESKAYSLARLNAVLFAEEVIGLAESAVRAVMFAVRHALQITGGKVLPIPINVMDEQSAIEANAKNLLGDESMNVTNLAAEIAGRITIQKKDALILFKAEFQQHLPLSLLERVNAIAASEHCCDPSRWFSNVELHCKRAAWACEENRAYPRRILLKIQPEYALWGAGIDCKEVT